MKAIVFAEENFQEIAKHGYDVPLDEFRETLAESLDFNETRYFVPQYVPKFEQKSPQPWVIIMDWYLEEEFTFDLPEKKTDWFEITRK